MRACQNIIMLFCIICATAFSLYGRAVTNGCVFVHSCLCFAGSNEVNFHGEISHRNDTWSDEANYCVGGRMKTILSSKIKDLVNVTHET